tara:strand:+ start:440 stop:550 length:111 start_codon:yes stop_codon:yes gene_type:complete
MRKIIVIAMLPSIAAIAGENLHDAKSMAEVAKQRAA